MADVLQGVSARLGDPPANVSLELEHEIRRDWGGDRPYIAKVGEAGHLERSRREAAIRGEHQRGERVGYLARKWGLSARRVQQIVKG